MRWVGILLVVLGALVLGAQWYRSAARGAPADPGRVAQGVPEVHPAVGGIAVVGGLLLLAGVARRD